MTSAKRLLVTIPTYNEAENIGLLIERIMDLVPGIDVLVIDDGSSDGTPDVVRQMDHRFPGRVHLLERAKKLGLGTAYVAAFKWAKQRRYDGVIEMDADHSHRPEDLVRIVDRLKIDPVVVGSRYVQGGGTQNWGFIRKLISLGGSFYARTILNVPLRDLTGGFNGWRMDVLDAINLDTIASEGYAFQVELKYRAWLADYTVTEIPITFVERRAGQSKMSAWIVVEAMYRVWHLAAMRKRLLADQAQQRLSQNPSCTSPGS